MLYTLVIGFFAILFITGIQLLQTAPEIATTISTGTIGVGETMSLAVGGTFAALVIFLFAKK